MAVKRIVKPWRTKPLYGTGINWANPITKGLLSAISNNEGGGNHSFDPVRQMLGGDDNGVTVSSCGPLGRIYASGYYGGERLGPAFSAHVDELTLIIRYATNDVSVVTRNALCTSTASGSDGQWVRNVSGAYEARYTDGYTPKTVTGTTAPSNGVFRTVAMTIKKNGYLRLYVDGVEEGTAQTTHATNPLYVSGTFLKVGNKACGYNTYTNTLTVDFAYAFTRELSAREIAEITANPNIIYQPQALWIPIAAGGGGTITSEASPGSFSITGVAATGLYNRIAAADPGTFTLTGTAATGLYGRVSTAESGTFTITGVAAEGVYTPAGAYTSIASPGSFAITGVAATGVYVPLNHYTSNGAPGAFTITGSNTTISRTYIVTASPGSFTITGVAATGVYGSNDIVYSASSFSPIAKARTRDNILKIKTRTPAKRIKI